MTKLRNVLTKFKARRRSKPAMPAIPACVVDSTELERQMDGVVTGVGDMVLSKSPHLPIAPSGTFDFRPPPGSPSWPGPRYDDLVQFVPGIFNRVRDMMLSTTSKTKSKRTVVKRSSSHDDKHASDRRKSPVKKQATPKKRKTKPQFVRPPPARDEPLHLMSLPGEIRNQIYRYLYVSKEPLKAHYRHIIRPHQGLPTRLKRAPKRFPREPTLALVCKQLQREATSLFYAENTFVFAPTPPSLVAAVPYSRSMAAVESVCRWRNDSKATDALTRVELCLGGNGVFGIPPEYSRQSVKYTFTRVPDGSTEIKQDLEGSERCVCLEKGVLEAVREDLILNDDNARKNLLYAAVAVIGKRNVAMKKIECAASWKTCDDCGKGDWRFILEVP